jgi:UDP-N-acetylmuramate--alanine ligase
MIENFDNFKKIYFAGVGGIGISAVARLMIADGKEVWGSDMAASTVTSELEKIGVKFQTGQNVDQIPRDTDLVIYSIALDELDPNFMSALKEKFPNHMSYPESLAIISKNKKTIAITGTHGKTTTTSMIATAMKDLGFDPTVIVGSLLKEWNSNFLPGSSEYFVVEGCEYKKSFLNLHPYILVITNIEEDHLDYYKNLQNIKDAFRELAERVPTDGYIITDLGNPNVAEVVAGLQCHIIDYRDADVDGVGLVKMPGEHNRSNARVAMSVLQALGADTSRVKNSLSNFSGVWRRFEYIGRMKTGALVYDDYAHHPTEIKAFLRGARGAFVGKKIIAIFQPHLFSRTKDFLDDFSHSFENADEVIILPIYKAREIDNGEVSSGMLVEKIRNTGKHVDLMTSFADVVEYLNSKSHENTIIATIGAGETNILATQLVESV